MDRVEGFDWDEGNARKSADQHGVSQAEAESLFFCDPLVVTQTRGTVKRNAATTRSGGP